MKKIEEKKEKSFSRLVCTAYPDGNWYRIRGYGEERYVPSGGGAAEQRGPDRSPFFGRR